MPTMTIFDEMVAAYNPQNAEQRLNAQHQVMQQIVLAGLQKGGFFEHAAFYGGTCLRIFHGLPRFSEDMDFSLTEKNPAIHLEHYFGAIQDVLFKIFSTIKSVEMFVSCDIAELVGKNLGVTDEVAACAMRMTEDPIVDIGAFDVVR